MWPWKQGYPEWPLFSPKGVHASLRLVDRLGTAVLGAQMMTWGCLAPSCSSPHSYLRLL